MTPATLTPEALAACSASLASVGGLYWFVAEAVATQNGNRPLAVVLAPEGLMVGDRVWQQMYSPTYPRPAAGILERVAGGRLYGERTLCTVESITPTYDGGETTRWVLRRDGGRGDSAYSYVASDWCVLERAEPEDGALW